ITWETIQTTTKAATASGTVTRLSSGVRLIIANPASRTSAWSSLPAWKIAAISGTNAPAATNPLILFSINSNRSNGFFRTDGSAVPNVSFTKASVTKKKPGTQNQGRAYQGNFPRFSVGVLKYFQAPTALTPSNGEMATPVIVAMAWAASTPGVDGLEARGGWLAGSAA